MHACSDSLQIRHDAIDQAHGKIQFFGRILCGRQGCAHKGPRPALREDQLCEYGLIKLDKIGSGFSQSQGFALQNAYHIFR
jgi:hypothetical protein